MSNQNECTDNAVLANIKHCLHDLRFVNVVICKIEKVKKETFVITNAKHLALLETFWTNMMPDVRRLPGHPTYY